MNACLNNRFEVVKYLFKNQIDYVKDMLLEKDVV